MAFITGLLFAFTIAIYAAVAGIAIGIVIGLIYLIYTTPFLLWLGSQHCVGRYKHIPTTKAWRHATILYRHKLFGKELTL